MRLRDNYLIIEQIGSGSFGDVYSGRDIKTGEEIAIKVENSQKNKRIRHEYKVYKYLKRSGVGNIVPNIIDFIVTPGYNFMCMQMLGSSLDDIFNQREQKFSIDTVIQIGEQIIKIMEQIHRIGFLHRDIKPSNFMVGKHDPEKIYIMDFGLSKKLYDNHKHIKFREGRNMIGTVRYCSINMHLGLEPSRRDDMESIGYMLVYFAQGNLPWQGLKKVKGVNHLDTIGEVKMCTNIDILCKNLPKCFKEYIIYCRNLKFDEEVDYKHLIDIFSCSRKNTSEQLDWIN